MIIEPANSGVIIQPTNHPGHCDGVGHKSGYVLARGRGVPWLTEGDVVFFPREFATELEIDYPTGDYAGNPVPTPEIVHVGFLGPDVKSMTVYLVDQRHIHGVVRIPTTGPGAQPR